MSDSAAPESRGVMEPDLLEVVLRGGAMDGGGVALGVTETGGGVGMPEAAFSKSSTCREAGRLLLPPMRPLICCALDLRSHHQQSHSMQPTVTATVSTPSKQQDQQLQWKHATTSAHIRTDLRHWVHSTPRIIPCLNAVHFHARLR